MLPAIFLDRDGVINPEIYYPDTNSFESPRTAEEFTLLPAVTEALSRLQKAGFLLFIVSNQPNYAKGKVSMEGLNSIHRKMEHLLQDAGIALTECFYCYHHPDGITPGFSGPCQCRKPSPYFLLHAREKYHLDMENSWMIGDRDTDIECGKNAGVKTLKIGDAQGGSASLYDALRFVMP